LQRRAIVHFLLLTAHAEGMHTPRAQHPGTALRCSIRHRSSYPSLAVFLITVFPLRFYSGEDFLVFIPAENEHELFEKVGIEFVPHFFLHNLEGLKEAFASLVRPHCGEGVEYIGDATDFTVKMDLVTAEPARISPAVIPFMVLHDDDPRFIGETVHFLEKFVSIGRVPAYDHPFFLGEGALFIQHIERCIAFSYIVEEKAASDFVHVVGRIIRKERFGEPGGEDPHIH
jgi:hypothetical protein